MGKSSGTTRPSSKSNPKGLSSSTAGSGTPVSPAVSIQIEKWQTGIDNLQRSLRETEKQIDELNKENELLFSDMKADPDDREYYESQIAENDKMIDELEGTIHRTRLKIANSEKQIKKLKNG